MQTMAKKIDYVKQGKRNKINGANFERLVRKDLESKGWIVDKWTNNVEFEEFPDDDGIPFKSGKVIPAKPGRFRMMQTGFPDFIAYVFGVPEESFGLNGVDNIRLIFIECKTNGRLDKIEKQKAKWYLDNNYCSKFLIASKEKEGRKVVVKYEEFK